MHKQIPNASAFMLSSFRRKYFMLDPNFPKRLLQAGNERTIEFIQFLSTEYSKRGLTEKTDRCAAISGLESHIAEAKKCETRFGIFESFLHRSLLWQRSEERDTERIDYGAQVVPSWSWMAYNGSIEFTNIPFGEVEWVRGLRFNNKPNEQSGSDEDGKWVRGLRFNNKPNEQSGSDEDGKWVRGLRSNNKPNEQSGSDEDGKWVRGLRFNNKPNEQSGSDEDGKWVRGLGVNNKPNEQSGSDEDGKWVRGLRFNNKPNEQSGSDEDGKWVRGLRSNNKPNEQSGSDEEGKWVRGLRSNNKPNEQSGSDEDGKWVRGLGVNNKPNEQSGSDKEWKSALVTDIGSFQRCNFKRRGIGYAILDLDGTERGWIQYDVETHKPLDAERCVVVGRDSGESDAGKREYYILVVRSTGMENEYTRVGAGWILSDYVARQGVQALIV
jgi:hypothetical protein